MNRAKPFINRLVKLKQQQIQDASLIRKLQQIKPVTKKQKQHSEIIINHGKKMMIREEREIQIERDNQFLLQKINKLMTKTPVYSSSKLKKANAKVNKSLNQIYRKHQIEEIQQQNRRFLNKLQNKRASLNIEQWQRDWEANKIVCKRLANVGFHTTNIKPSIRIRSIKNNSTLVKYQNMKLTKQKTIDGYDFQVKIQFTGEKLKIVCQLHNSKQAKIIEIPKEEAIIFIDKQCNGSFQNLAQKLHYDSQTQVLFIASQCLQEDNNQLDFNPQINQFVRRFEKQSKPLQQYQDQTEILQKKELNSMHIQDQIYFAQRQPKKVQLIDQKIIETVKEQAEDKYDQTDQKNQGNQAEKVNTCLVLKQQLIQNSAFIAEHKEINSPQTQIISQSGEINKEIIVPAESLQNHQKYQVDFTKQSKQNKFIQKKQQADR